MDLQSAKEFAVQYITAGTTQTKWTMPAEMKGFTMQNLTATPFYITHSSMSTYTFRVAKNTTYSPSCALFINQEIMYIRATAASTIQILYWK